MEDRQAWLEGLSMPGGPLTINAPHSTLEDRNHFRIVRGEAVPKGARRKLHTALLQAWSEATTNPGRRRRAMVFAGPPAAGKSTLMRALGSDASGHRRIDADDFKALLLGNAVLDDSLPAMLPESLRTVRTQFYPLELSALVHRESTLLQERALNASMRAGEDLAIDGTLANKYWAEKLINQLANFGYSIHLVDVETDMDVALERVLMRWRMGYQRALDHPADPEAAMGGRWLPSTAVTRLFGETREADSMPLLGRSVSELNVREIATAVPEVCRYDLYRTASASGGPICETSWERKNGDWVTV